MPDQVSGIFSPYLRSQRINAALPHIRGSVLDVGCGVGHLVEHLPEDCGYYGCDRDLESLTQAAETFPKREFSVDMPESDRRFDSVVALAVIEHISDPVQFIQSVVAYMKPDGRVIMTTPNPNLEWAHHLGAKVGLFSAEADDEHESLLNRKGIEDAVAGAGLTLSRYQKFLFGANQLFVAHF